MVCAYMDTNVKHKHHWLLVLAILSLLKVPLYHSTPLLPGWSTDREELVAHYGPDPLSSRHVLIGLSPFPVTVTTRIITFLVGDPYKPSFATVTGRGDNPIYCLYWLTWSVELGGKLLKRHIWYTSSPLIAPLLTAGPLKMVGRLYFSLGW